MSAFNSIIAYVMQDDILLPIFTPKGTFTLLRQSESNR